MTTMPLAPAAMSKVGTTRGHDILSAQNGATASPLATPTSEPAAKKLRRKKQQLLVNQISTDNMKFVATVEKTFPRAPAAKERFRVAGRSFAQLLTRLAFVPKENSQNITSNNTINNFGTDISVNKTLAFDDSDLHSRCVQVDAENIRKFFSTSPLDEEEQKIYDFLLKALDDTTDDGIEAAAKSAGVFLPNVSVIVFALKKILRFSEKDTGGELLVQTYFHVLLSALGEEEDILRNCKLKSPSLDAHQVRKGSQKSAPAATAPGDMDAAKQDSGEECDVDDPMEDENENLDDEDEDMGEYSNFDEEGYDVDESISLLGKLPTIDDLAFEQASTLSQEQQQQSLKEVIDAITDLGLNNYFRPDEQYMIGEFAGAFLEFGLGHLPNGCQFASKDIAKLLQGRLLSKDFIHGRKFMFEDFLKYGFTWGMMAGGPYAFFTAVAPERTNEFISYTAYIQQKCVKLCEKQDLVGTLLILRRGIAQCKQQRRMLLDATWDDVDIGSTPNDRLHAKSAPSVLEPQDDSIDIASLHRWLNSLDATQAMSLDDFAIPKVAQQLDLSEELCVQEHESSVLHELLRTYLPDIFRLLTGETSGLFPLLLGLGALRKRFRIRFYSKQEQHISPVQIWLGNGDSDMFVDIRLAFLGKLQDGSNRHCAWLDQDGLEKAMSMLGIGDSGHSSDYDRDHNDSNDYDGSGDRNGGGSGGNGASSSSSSGGGQTSTHRHQVTSNTRRRAIAVDLRSAGDVSSFAESLGMAETRVTDEQSIAEGRLFFAAVWKNPRVVLGSTKLSQKLLQSNLSLRPNQTDTGLKVFIKFKIVTSNSSLWNILHPLKNWGAVDLSSRLDLLDQGTSSSKLITSSLSEDKLRQISSRYICTIYSCNEFPYSSWGSCVIFNWQDLCTELYTKQYARGPRTDQTAINGAIRCRRVIMEELVSHLEYITPENIESLPVLVTNFSQMALGLAFLHANGIAHGDFSPSNTMFREIACPSSTNKIAEKKYEAVIIDLDECGRIGSRRQRKTLGFAEEHVKYIDAPGDVYGLGIVFAHYLHIWLLRSGLISRQGRPNDLQQAQQLFAMIRRSCAKKDSARNRMLLRLADIFDDMVGPVVPGLELAMQKHRQNRPSAMTIARRLLAMQAQFSATTKGNARTTIPAGSPQHSDKENVSWFPPQSTLQRKQTASVPKQMRLQVHNSQKNMVERDEKMLGVHNDNDKLIVVKKANVHQPHRQLAEKARMLPTMGYG